MALVICTHGEGVIGEGEFLVVHVGGTGNGGSALGGFHHDVAVLGEAGTGGDEVAEDDVLLEAFEHIHLAESGGLGKDTGGVLEGGGGDEGLGLEGGLGDTQEDGLAVGGAAMLLHSLLVDAGERGAVHLVAPEETGIARVLHAHLAEHLGNDDFNVLVVDFHTLHAVHLLHLFLELYEVIHIREMA